MGRRTNKLSEQVKAKVSKTKPKKPKKKPEYDGDFGHVISTGSTLLDLSISGGRIRGGGLPGGVLVEIFGPSQSGKTVLLCEIAGAVQRKNGQVLFKDPEARLNKQFSKLFDLDPDEIDYSTPKRVPEVFKSVRDWSPDNTKIINGIFTDSLAALSTDLELDNADGDKMGGRRAKEFSEELRKTCVKITENNYLMICSNQIRENMGAMPGTPKFKTPGGHAMEFYSSLRLKVEKAKGSKIKETRRIAGKEVTRVVGVKSEIEVFKNSIWEPYRIAPIYIYFKYGIDDIRPNLQFIKDHTKNTVYTLNGEKLSNSMEEAIQIVEEDELENDLKEEVIDLWEEIENKFKSERKPKRR